MDLRLFVRSLSKEEKEEIKIYLNSDENKTPIEDWVQDQYNISLRLRTTLLNNQYCRYNKPFIYAEDIDINSFRKLKNVSLKIINELESLLKK
ncbi:hypothetical protein FHS04_002823 [Mesoflavibacter sabulilitoris]|uniref:Uncharacterized protein n=1 Tax=Mesoflavibacter zeaxanthinifaciens subsp. sabulilitoris TaxID=1520893 RepID=A0A2T1NNQ9_9FLAO|nr:hypothetical protein [Mesoflavibacter zeaxanthinifaciens]MBB3125279.1 hypothetical protein [Mesoflavibacter zeaxanthinifaciens subsp. sabulilitoris]PSG94515.1 hypothetical protein C7H61_00850 [Mesoflavibacter zeaxanthinifaciens subsp. sabulilitoris]